MRVIIPAAGRGSRLAPFTDRSPKGLVPVSGEPLLWHTLRELRTAGADLAVVVRGHRADLLTSSLLSCPDRPALEFVTNTSYADTNSIVSLWLTRGWWDEDFCIVDGDVLASHHMIERVFAAGGNVLAIDATKSYDDIDMKAEFRDGRLMRLGKELPRECSAGEFFGVSRWTADGAVGFAAAISRRLAAGGQRDWYEDAICDAAGSVRLDTVAAFSSEWAEVDRAADIPFAEQVVRSWRRPGSRAQPSSLTAGTRSKR